MSSTKPPPRRQSSQQIELIELAVEDLARHMGWKKLPDRAADCVFYWFARFFDLGRDHERVSTLKEKERADSLALRAQKLESENRFLKSTITKLQGLGYDAIHIDADDEDKST